MAVSKRTRYEVLKRDSHTCRYCGASAPDATLTVDHVVPVSLGGSDAPDNLVAACRDCNAGKASTSPNDAVVEDVKTVDLRWSGAIKRVAAACSRQHRKEDKYAAEFLDYWNSWRNGRGETTPLPDSWESSIRRFFQLGVTLDDLIRCADVTMTNNRIWRDDRFRYFAGCVWRVVTEMQDAAKAMLEVEDA